MLSPGAGLFFFLSPLIASFSLSQHYSDLERSSHYTYCYTAHACDTSRVKTKDRRAV